MADKQTYAHRLQGQPHKMMVGWWDGGMAGWWDGGMVGWQTNKHSTVASQATGTIIQHGGQTHLLPARNKLTD